MFYNSKQYVALQLFVGKIFKFLQYFGKFSVAYKFIFNIKSKFYLLRSFKYFLLKSDLICFLHLILIFLC